MTPSRANRRKPGEQLNEQLHDPTLRSFRQPLTIRLREKIDELRGVINAQATAIAKQGRENAELQRELRRTRRELANANVRVQRAERLVLERGDTAA